MQKLSAANLAIRRLNSDESCPRYFVDRPGHDRREGLLPRHAGRASLRLVFAHPCAQTVSGGALRVDRARGCNLSGFGVPGPTPSMAVAPRAVDEVGTRARRKESACKPGSVESSHSSAMRVAA